ncbi:MAG: acyl--CoA ligase [Acidobacteria bacterium]|nr:acyl--CoA ligase [Acidobacteriota bacterium]
MTQFLALTEFIDRNAEWYPGKTAVVCEGKRLLWGEFGRRIRRIANRLNLAGVAKGDKIAILSRNCLEYPEIVFGALKAGAVIVPLSTMLQPETILLQLQDAEPKAIFAEEESAHRIGANRLPQIRIILGGAEEGWTGYEDFLHAGSEDEPGIILSPDDWYNIIYSSGTTGVPKGIVHTHQARVNFAMTCGLEFRVHNETVSLISTPLYANGTQLIFLPTILMCGTLVLMRSFDAAGFLDLVQRERVTHAFLVPTQFIRIMEHPQFSGCDTSSVEILLSAAAPLRKETKSDILQKFPNSRLAELYGLTEGISTVLRPDEQLSRLGSVGKPRLGGDIKIIDAEGRELPRGEAGEIAGCNFSMMAEYYRNPQKTQEALWKDDGGRTYVRTGDIGKLDADGYLYILDRKKDLIISGGINIFPSDIEAILLKHPEIEEVAVIGIPHPEWGECPLALVVKKDARSPLSAESLREWANDRLAAYQRLAVVEFRLSLPKNDLGKILKNELRTHLPWK